MSISSRDSEICAQTQGDMKAGQTHLVDESNGYISHRQMAIETWRENIPADHRTDNGTDERGNGVHCHRTNRGMRARAR